MKTTATLKVIIAGLLLSGSVLLPLAAIAQSATNSFWNATATPVQPTESDAKSVEIGIKFTSSVGGTISAIRFYKGIGNTSAHTVNFWSANGLLMASAASSNESSSGWQTVPLPAPVTIAAGVPYTASYHTLGHYSFSSDYFTSPFVSGPLTAPVGAGVFAYSAQSAFPHSTYNDGNYWVDLVFTPSVPPPVTAAPYVQPGTQGYQDTAAALTVYSAANGQVPPNTQCSWNKTYLYLNCFDTDLALDHVYIQGGLYWRGCGNLTVTNSIVDWQPSKSWFDIQNACQTWNGSSAITIKNSTLRTGAPTGGTAPNQTYPVYTGQSDVGPVNEYTGLFPIYLYNSVIAGFPQGVDPGANSIIQNNEIYTQLTACRTASCHTDGLFSQGGNNITYQGNYILVQLDSATAAIFYQSNPASTGNRVIGNFLQGGSYTLYNETSTGLDVENNTFGGARYGDCSLSSGASWGTWSGNIHPDGSPVTPSGAGCN